MVGHYHLPFTFRAPSEFRSVLGGARMTVNAGNVEVHAIGPNASPRAVGLAEWAPLAWMGRDC